MDKAALFAMLASQAPKLLAALNTPTNSPGSMFDGEMPLDPAFGREETLMEMVGNRGYDPGLIEDSMPSYLNDSSAASMAVDALRPDMFGTQKGFPSDFATQNDIQAIANGIRVGETPAEISAGSMLANDPSIGLSNLYEGSEVIGGDDDLSSILKSSDTVPGTNVPWDDRDMDALHSSEGWDDGSNYKLNPKLVDWYKKNKR